MGNRIPYAPMLKLAVIDLGTNVIKVLVGSVDQQTYTILYQNKITSAISQQPFLTNVISPEMQKNITDILISIKKNLEIEGVTYIVTKATSLFREASNQAEVISAIREASNMEVTIISEQEEAELTYLGICSSIALNDENSLIVDIGGGSVECIIFNKVGPLWMQSFGLGVGRVASQFVYNDPITAEQTAHLTSYYHTILIPLFKAVASYKPTKLIGSSGAFRTLLTLYQSHYAGSHTGKLRRLSKEEFLQTYALIQSTPTYVWQKQVAIEPIFLKWIPLSSTMVNLIMERCNLQEIVVINHSWATGLFIQEWHRLKTKNLI